MSKMISRRRFAKNSLAAAASLGILPARAFAGKAPKYVEAVVIGSGFGGAVAALRLGLHGIETVVLERGRRWPYQGYRQYFLHQGEPRWPVYLAKQNNDSAASGPQLADRCLTGVFDRKVGTGMTAFFGAGVGGSSLVYGGITLQPPKELFHKMFPKSISYEELDRVYFPRVRKMLNATPIPDDILETQMPIYRAASC